MHQPIAGRPSACRSNTHGWLPHAWAGVVLLSTTVQLARRSDDPWHLLWARPVNAEAHTLRFLVVDDNEEIREVFCRLVRRAGHLASIAKDGLEALDSLQRESFDVMLLDLSMPRMNGVEVVRWLRDNPAVAPDMRIVVVSAWTGEQRGVLQELGVDTVMQKPLRIQQLTDLIAEGLLDQAAPAGGMSGGRGCDGRDVDRPVKT